MEDDEAIAVFGRADAFILKPDIGGRLRSYAGRQKQSSDLFQLEEKHAGLLKPEKKKLKQLEDVRG